MLTTYAILNKLVSLKIETKVTILKILQCWNVVESRYQEKGVEGEFDPKKKYMYKMLLGIICI